MPDVPHKTPLIPPHGGYKHLKSFQIAQLVYDLTVYFVGRYIPCNSRTCDQMVQAARSGVQNIAEGSQASGTSKKTELQLTNVARASLEELKLDYEDFLRQRGLSVWGAEDPRPAALVAARFTSVDEVRTWINGLHDAEHRPRTVPMDEVDGMDDMDSGARQRPHMASCPCPPSPPCPSSPPAIPPLPASRQALRRPAASASSPVPEIAANAVLTLIRVACSLLDRQIVRLAADFEEYGGFTERLYRVRSKAASKNKAK